MTDNTPKVNPQDLLEMSSQIVSAHVSNNTISVTDIPALIQQVYQTLASVDANRSKDFDRPQPAVPVKKSVTDEHIVCLEDGKKLKMLKRHLKTSFNMTPEQYRERWNLPADYPMVAPNYAKQRSMLAKDIGLGRRRLKEAA
jgi:predicted transcriptional regulator